MPTDSQNMLAVLKQFPKQCKEALELPKGYAIKGDFNKILVTGMGGSAIGGDMLKAYMHSSKIPVFVNRDYHVPGWVDEKTLVFAVSYSGNTEETISSVTYVLEKKAKVIGVTSGGELVQEVDKCVLVPKGMQPRAALAYLFFPMLGILHNSGIIKVTNDELNELLAALKDVEKFNESGEMLAKKIKEKTAIIYGSERLASAAYRWKTQINENAKSPAFYNVFSEMNHNEIAGCKFLDKSFIAIMLKDKDDHVAIKKRMMLSKEIMEEKIAVEEVEVQGKHLLTKLISTIYLGDFVSYHLALWKRVDPTPVDIIEGLKKKLG